MIISIDTEKAFDKIQHLFIIKILNKIGIEGRKLPQPDRRHLRKHIAKIIPNG